MRVCPNCGGEIAIRNPTGNCDHLYWPDYLTPEAKAKVAEEQEREMGCEKLAAEAHTENDYDTAPTDPAHGGKIWKPTK